MRIAWLYKEINTTSSLAVNIKSMKGFKIIYFDNNNTFQDSFIDEMIIKYESIVHAYRIKYWFSHKFIRKYSINLFFSRKGHILNNESKTNV